MIEIEIRDKVTQLRTAVFGVEGRGGLVHEVDNMQERLAEAEKRLNAVSGKWLMLMLLAGLLGNALGGSVLQALFRTLRIF